VRWLFRACHRTTRQNLEPQDIVRASGGALPPHPEG